MAEDSVDALSYPRPGGKAGFRGQLKEGGTTPSDRSIGLRATQLVQQPDETILLPIGEIGSPSLRLDHQIQHLPAFRRGEPVPVPATDRGEPYHRCPDLRPWDAP